MKPCSILSDVFVQVDMAASQFADDLVRDYLRYRGFFVSLRAFDSEVKADKDKAFRVSRSARLSHGLFLALRFHLCQCVRVRKHFWYC